MAITGSQVQPGKFFIGRRLRGRNTVREIVSTLNVEGETFVHFRVYNLLWQKNPQYGENTLSGFCMWAKQIVTGPDDVDNVN